MKHTKAPWTAGPTQHHEDQAFANISADGIGIATARTCSMRPSVEEMEANAKLIAASSLLLEQLKWMIEAHDACNRAGDRESRQVNRDDWAMSLRAARQWIAELS